MIRPAGTEHQGLINGRRGGGYEDNSSHRGEIGWEYPLPAFQDIRIQENQDKKGGILLRKKNNAKKLAQKTHDSAIGKNVDPYILVENFVNLLKQISSRNEQTSEKNSRVRFVIPPKMQRSFVEIIWDLIDCSKKQPPETNRENIEYF